MINVLEDNYQLYSTNRFVVESPRFWREEYHPRFKDITTENEIKDLFTSINNNISFKLDNSLVDLLGTHFYNYLSGFRFSFIPSKDPQSVEQFKSFLFIVLMEVIPHFSYKAYKLNEKDFNLVTNRGNLGSLSKTATGINENQYTESTDKTGTATHETTDIGNTKRTTTNNTEKDNLESMNNTKAGYTGETNSNVNNTADVSNTDTEAYQNSKTINDVFLSPQNQGVTPITDNIQHLGVDGITIDDNSTYTTNTANTNFGYSDRTQNNISNASQSFDNEVNESQSTEQFNQNNSILENINTIGSDNQTTDNLNNSASVDNENIYNSHLDNTNTVNNENQTTSEYMESLDFNRGARLQDFYNLNVDRLMFEILGKLTYWILRCNIARSSTNYINIQEYV